MSYSEIYHMCDVNDFKNQLNEHGVYYPPTFQQDGFVHAAAQADLLLGIANNFYRDDRGQWICITIAVDKLTSEVKYEAPAGVGDKKSNSSSNMLFPHIYGPINKESVVNYAVMVRDETGAFLEISKESKQL